MILAGWNPPALDLVGYIVGICSGQEVVWIYADPIVTCVASMIRPLSIRNKVSSPVGWHDLAIHRAVTIAINLTDMLGPVPASAGHLDASRFQPLNVKGTLLRHVSILA